MNINVYRDFQVCISVPLKEFTNPMEFNMNDLLYTANLTTKGYLKPRGKIFKNRETGNQDNDNPDRQNQWFTAILLEAEKETVLFGAIKFLKNNF